jgi:hypothetical protein
MDDDLKMEMLAEDNSEYDEVEFVSDIENEAGNVDEELVVEPIVHSAGIFSSSFSEQADTYNVNFHN